MTVAATPLLDSLLAGITHRVASLDHTAPVTGWQVREAADGTPWLTGRLTDIAGVQPLDRMRLIEHANAGRRRFHLAWTSEGLSLDFRIAGVWVSLFATDPTEGRRAA